MIELEVLKKVIDTLPISGDVVEIVKNDKIIYKSGRELPLKEKNSLKEGYKVRSVTHEFNEKDKELYISIDHYNDQNIVNNWYRRIVIGNSKIIRVQRRLKLEKLGWIK